MVIPTASIPKSTEPNRAESSSPEGGTTVAPDGNAAAEEEAKEEVHIPTIRRNDVLIFLSHHADRCMELAEKLGKDGGQHALAAAHFLDSAIRGAGEAENAKKQTELIGQCYELGMQIADSMKARHQPGPKKTETPAPQVELSPKEKRWQRFYELRVKVEAKTASEEEQKEFQQIDAEMSADVRKATRNELYWDVFRKIRSELIDTIAAKHVGAIVSSDRPIDATEFQSSVQHAIEQLEALQLAFPEPPPFLCLVGV